jgi:DNA repair ATPase RecN
MSELTEIRRALHDIRAATAATATDVQWIKQGMQRETDRMDAQDARLHKVERRLNWFAGAGAVIGSMLGAAIAAAFNWLARHT